MATFPPTTSHHNRVDAGKMAYNKDVEDKVDFCPSCFVRQNSFCASGVDEGKLLLKVATQDPKDCTLTCTVNITIQLVSEVC